jgi:endonuclease G
MKKLILIAYILLFTSAAFGAAPCAEMVFKGKFPKTKEKVEIICKSRYVVGYSLERKAPLWVAEKLTKENVDSEKVQRANTFRTDPAIPLTNQPTLADFIGTIYDRGHLVAFEDLADDANAADESFFLTNIVPQVSDNNRGIWKAIEGRVRKLTITREYVFVVNMPIYDEPVLTLKSGAQIPSRLVKLVLSPTSNESFAVIVPNISGLHSADIPKYMSTLAGLKDANPTVNLNPSRYSKFADKDSLK